MAAKVIHFKKNGSSAPQKFVADDGGNNISAFLSSPRGAGTILLPFYRHRAARKQYFCLFIVTAQRGNNIFSFYRLRAAREQYFLLLSPSCGAGTIFLRLAAIFYSKKRKWRYVIAGTHGRCIPAIGIDFYFFQASIMALKSTGFSEAPPIKPPSMLGLAKSSPAFDALQLPP